MTKNKENAKITNIGFHFRVWINTEKQEIAIDSCLFGDEVRVAYYCLHCSAISAKGYYNGTEYSAVYFISGTINCKWFEDIKDKEINKIIRKSIKDFFFEKWNAKMSISDWELNSWLKEKVFEKR